MVIRRAALFLADNFTYSPRRKMSSKPSWLDSTVKGFVLDISGVIYNSQGDSGEPIPGSIEAIELLRKNDVPFCFCTNESTASRKHLCQKLRKIGFDILQEEIIAPAPVVAKVLHDRGLRPFFLVKEEVLEEFHDVNTLNPNCVVIGDAQENFTYENVNRAFSVLINSPSPVLLSMGRGRYYREMDGLKIDVGAYCKGLEYACGIQAECFGKPDASYFRSACELIELPAGNVVMIGDDLLGDIGGAQAAGMRGVLVKTGKYTSGDEKKLKNVAPDGVVDNLLEAVQDFLKFSSGRHA